MKLLETIKKHPQLYLLLFFIIVLLAFIPKQSSQTIEHDTAPTADTKSSSIPSAQPVAKNTCFDDNIPVVENAYFDDDIVNIFFEKYNSISTYPISVYDIQKGNIETKALVYTDLFSMKVVNSCRGFLSISISSSPEYEDTVLKTLFSDCLNSMRPTLSDDSILSAWDALHETGYMVEGYALSDVSISYVPSVELSKGYSDLRIDLSIPIKLD